MTKVTIQRTGKPYKAMTAIGGIGFFIGVPVLFFGGHGGASAYVMVASILLYFVGKIGGWWANG